ncbi:hypothetical protein AVEN_204020-1 [Araneus ventricosus]|uniref:Uncharacterized protein n=1 Tax=Araneus ventricosus TaxID=182803 RepID=A0A4Y2QTY6_ARAVE|nr:hypothetical protein AVEN_204020-1 [Araneus ventricosus]
MLTANDARSLAISMWLSKSVKVCLGNMSYFIWICRRLCVKASFPGNGERTEGHGPFVTYHHRFGLSSHDRCVCGDKSDPNHYATDCPVTKPFHFTKPSAVNLSTWCRNIVQNKISLAQLVNIMKILHERRHDIVI